MPAEISNNLPVNMAAAEQSQLLQTMNQMQERGLNLAAADRTQVEAKQAATETVQSTKESEGSPIQGEGKGAHSHTLQKDGREKPDAEAPPPEPPPDPAGRGRLLDVQL